MPKTDILDRLRWRRDEVVATIAATDPAVAARAYAYLFGLGGLLAALVPLAPGAAVQVPVLLAASTAAAFAVALGVLLSYGRTPHGVLRALPALGALMVTASMFAVTAQTRPAYMVLCFWVVLAAFFFYGTPSAFADLALVVAVSGAALADGGAPGWAALWIATAVTMAVGGVLLSVLRRRADTLILALDSAARSDALTGLLNRRGLEVALGDELERARRTDRCCCLLYVDVDDFKAYNDTHGHAAGDAALVRVARVLRDSRRNDRAARTGGDEFVLVLADTDRAGGVSYAHRLLEVLRSGEEPAGPPVDVSIGVACFPADGEDERSLQDAADRALYAAKRAGGRRAVAFGDDAPDGAVAGADGHRD